MKKPAPCLSEAATINGAILVFGTCAHTLLPLINTEGKLTGIVTKTDVYRAMTHGQDFGDRISTIATCDVAVLHRGQAVRDALQVLYMKDVKQAPVLDQESRPIGILSHLDIAEARIRLHDRASEGTHVSSDTSFSGSHE